MHKHGFFPRLAFVNMLRNIQVYGPYLLTVIGTAAAFYIVCSLAYTEDLPVMVRYVYLSVFMTIGVFVIAVFSMIFLTYTNSFLMKRRKRELGLYYILGLGKGHIALLLGVESLYTALAGIGGGLAVGLLLQKLVTLLLCKIMGVSAYFGFYVSWKGIQVTVVLFSLILLGNLLLNLRRIHAQNPIELLHESNTGEREPKTRWVTAVFGTLCLGGGYGIAVFARTKAAAFQFYFLAVLLVILGTYALFSAVSIAVLKALRANKRVYYQPEHFIGISGMLYRMRRNAAGLANICILSTMVLVMVSGTLSLYLSFQTSLDDLFPGNVMAEVYYDDSYNESEPLHEEAVNAAVLSALREQGCPAQSLYSYHRLSLSRVEASQDGYIVRNTSSQATEDDLYLNIITADDYASVAPDARLSYAPVTIQFTDTHGKRTPVRVWAAVLEERQFPAETSLDILNKVWLVLEDGADWERLCSMPRQNETEYNISWTGYWTSEASEETLLALGNGSEMGPVLGAFGYHHRFVTKPSFVESYLTINGGFFFLGLFLGFLFIMAAVLIIYYKQVSEGYEDRERFLIMQKVGMDEQMVRHSINSQVRIVFFAPLLVAAVHVAFDYGIMVRLLSLFGLYAPSMTLLCTVGTFAVFAVLYALVYWATAKTYYKIVQA